MFAGRGPVCAGLLPEPWHPAMSWYTAFRLRQFARGSLRVTPLAGGLLGVLLGAVVELADRSVHLPSYWTYSASTASTVLSQLSARWWL